jgi:hypothetical protein
MANQMTCLECEAALSGPPSKKFCNNAHAAKFKRKQKLADKKASAVEDAVRILSDGFYLTDLPREIERIRNARGIVASLEAALAAAVADDALWPVGKLGRIAVVLALLKNPSLARTRWRHPHERRRLPGQPRLPTGTGIRAHGTPGSRV